ncbi:DUF1499 domain-containing protein [Micromonospora marina]|uniref:DUF1499 domain-containing protein n=1 Tax=Micromonospora marina TaxID=307120 RepID=UPI00114C9E8A|nr:DUF1499 domain-containing protein [Micromonospora marina]
MSSFEEEAFIPVAPAEAMERLKDALQALGRVKSAKVMAGNSISVKTGISIKSWGETVTGSVGPASDGTVVHVRSQSRVRTTLIDYGRNRQNVKQVIEMIQVA